MTDLFIHFFKSKPKEKNVFPQTNYEAIHAQPSFSSEKITCRQRITALIWNKRMIQKGAN